MDWRNLLAFGSGIGLAIGPQDLEVTVARVRPSGIDVMGHAVIPAFRRRPAAQWGAHYTALLTQCGATHLAATVLLPRHEVIVRQITLPGVAGKDLASAIAFQLDTLHPYGEDDVAYGWSPLNGGGVLIGIVRRSLLEEYLTLFSEAGVATGSFTFSAAALHSAIRILHTPPAAGFLAVQADAAGGVEVYGESPAKPVFSAEFELPAERAALLAIAELRLPPETAPQSLDALLPAPKKNPLENDLKRSALPYAAALAGACPLLAPSANLLPVERRASHARGLFLPTAVLAGILLLAGGALLAFSTYREHRYARTLQAEIARIEPQARRSMNLDKEIEKTRARARLLDEFQHRSKDDLDALNELTRLLPPPIWTSSVELARDSVTLNGEANQAAGLVKIVDDSPFFQNTEFSVSKSQAGGEQFRIRTSREARK